LPHGHCRAWSLGRCRHSGVRPREKKNQATEKPV
jgi:hypothetical protein